MKIFLLGSIAFDELGQFKGYFKDLIHESHLEKLSLSFLVEDSVQSFGGCLGNVAYGLSLLNCPAVLCGVVGHDAEEYCQIFEGWGMDLSFLTVDAGGRTARALITSDLDGAQIGHFTPGVMGERAPDFEIPSNAEAGDLFLLGPENPRRMLQAAEQAKTKGLRVLFDPGQLLHVFSSEQLLSLVQGCEVLLLNEYEWQIFQQKTELSLEELLEALPLLVITRGELGLDLITKEGSESIQAFPAEFLEGTGAGDAFRAGFLAGLFKAYTYAQAAELGTVLGSASVELPFAQGYPLSSDRILALEKRGWTR